MRKPFRFFRHAICMVGRTLRSYALLSVTIVLSFTLLLGYLGFVDSEIYNAYKDVFRIDRGYLKAMQMSRNDVSFDLLLQKVSQRSDTIFYTVNQGFVHMSKGSFVTDEGQILPSREIEVEILSGNAWEFFQHLDERQPVTWLDGQSRDGISLQPGEAVLDRETYLALGLDQLEEPVYTFRLNTMSQSLDVTVRIVGLLEKEGSFFTQAGGELAYNIQYYPAILLPMEGFAPQDLEWLAPQKYAVFYSQRPEEIYQTARDLGIEMSLTDSIYRWQNECLETIQTSKSTKALITCAMLLILGINLYSSFSNALSERKFEIGVKRALGASRMDIVRQFLYESMTVMVVNILVSVALVVDIGLIYKLVVQATKGAEDFLYRTYTLYISPHSAAMFLTCSVTLTVVFSLIFAYKSTQVQVIDYLKAE